MIAPAAPIAPPAPVPTNIGLIMVFVLLTFGGWSEAVYVSAELRDVRRRIAPVMVGSLVLVTILYLLANLAYLRVLGLGGVAASEAVAADVLERAFGAPGCCADERDRGDGRADLGQRNADHRGADRLCARRGAPAAAPPSAGGTSGAARRQPRCWCRARPRCCWSSICSFTRKGFETAVEYTAPVFWFFFLLVGISLFVLQAARSGRTAAVPRPAVSAAAADLLRDRRLSALFQPRLHRHRRLFGIAVLAVGVVPLLALERRNRR